MDRRAMRAAQWRRALGVGLTVSVAAHVALFAAVGPFDAAGAADGPAIDANADAPRPEPTLEVVRLAEVPPPPSAVPAPRPVEDTQAAPRAGAGAPAASARTTPVPAVAPPAAAALAALPAITPSAATVELATGSAPPVWVAGDLRPATLVDLAGEAAREGDGRGFWEGLFDGVTLRVGVGGGGHCPTAGRVGGSIVSTTDPFGPRR